MQAISDGFQQLTVGAAEIDRSKDTAVSLGISRDSSIETWDSGDLQSHFIASSSKLFTFACFAKLQQVGELSLDQPVSRWIDDKTLKQVADPKTDLNQLTIATLLSNTSGISDYYKAKKLIPGSIEEQTKDDPGWDYQEVINISSEMKTRVAPTAKAYYSGTNYQLLEQLLGSIFKSFDEALRELVSGPLGLEKTFVFGESHRSMTDSIQPLKYGSENYLGYSRMASLGAEGGIVSTATETLRFLDALFKEEFLGSETTKNWLGSSNRLRLGIDYGQGLMFFKSKLVFGSKTLVGHIGATSHIAAHDPQTGSSFVATVNDFTGHKVSLKLLKQMVRLDRKGPRDK